MSTGINDKIKKLLAMAEHEGSNENEAQKAMELASMLMMRHGIDRAALMTPAAIIEGTMLPVNYDWYRSAAHAASLLYGVTSLWYKGVTEQFRFVGRTDNVHVAEETFAFLVLQIERLYKQALPAGLSKAERAKWRKSFKLVCAQRVHSRCYAIAQNPKTDDLTATQTGGTALAIINHRKELEEETSDYLGTKYPGMKSVKKRAQTVSHIGAAIAGQEAGNRVDLNRPTGTAPVAHVRRLA